MTFKPQTDQNLSAKIARMPDLLPNMQFGALGYTIVSPHGTKSGAKLNQSS